MSFNNPLGFNVSKAIPTTSTTNTNTTSTVTSQTASPAPSKHESEPERPNFKDVQEAKRPPSSSSSSPKVLQPAMATGISDVTPTTVSVTEGTNGSREKTDLIGLFDKFDVNKANDKNNTEENEEAEIDSLEEKMRQFKPKARQDSNMSTLDDKVEEKEHLSTHLESDQKTDEVSHIEGDHLDVEGNVSQEPVQETSVESLDKDPKSTEHKSAESTLLNKDESDLTLPDTGDPANEESLKQNTAAFQTNAENEDTLEAPPLAQTEYEGAGDEDVLLGTQLETVEDFQLKDDELSLEAPTSAPVRPRNKRNNSIQRAYNTINPQEQYQKSHNPFDFQTFLSHIRKKPANPIVRYIRSFLVSFTRQAPSMSTAQRIKAVRQFKQFIKGKFEEYEPFASMNNKDLENSNEGIEKLIMNRLYEYCFSPEVFKKYGNQTQESFLQDLREDLKFASCLDKFSWVLGNHLDIDLNEIAQRKKETSSDSLNYLDHAIKELNKMNSYRAPRDKIICILNSCKIIFSLLRVSKQETNADAFIPLLILVIIRAKTPNIISNVHYIERFRGEEWLMHGETSYYLSSLQGALSFIQNITKDDLTVSSEEFDANIEAWEADVKQRPPELVIPEPQASETNAAPVIRQNLSPSSVLMASAETVKNSITNYLSSPPPPESNEEPRENQRESAPAPGPSEEDIDAAFQQLSEMFPSLDKIILRDLVVMNDAKVEKTLDICLQLVNES